MNINNIFSTLNEFNHSSQPSFLKIDQTSQKITITEDAAEASSMKEISSFFKKYLQEERLTRDQVMTMQNSLSVIKQNPPWTKTALKALEGGPEKRKPAAEIHEAKLLECHLTLELTAIKILDTYLPAEKQFLKELLLSDLKCSQQTLAQRVLHLGPDEKVRIRALIAKIRTPKDAIDGETTLLQKDASGADRITDVTPGIKEEYMELVQLLGKLKFHPKASQQMFSIHEKTDALGSPQEVGTKKDRGVAAGTGVGRLKMATLDELSSESKIPSSNQLVRALLSAVKDAARARDVNAKKTIARLNSEFDDANFFIKPVSEGKITKIEELDLIQAGYVELEQSINVAKNEIDDLNPEYSEYNLQSIQENIKFLEWLKTNPEANVKYIKANACIRQFNEKAVQANKLIEEEGDPDELKVLGDEMLILSREIFREISSLDREVARGLIAPNLQTIKQACTLSDITEWLQELPLFEVPEMSELVGFPSVPPAIDFGTFGKENYLHDLFQNNLDSAAQALLREDAKGLGIDAAKTVYHAFLADSLHAALPEVSAIELKKAKYLLFLLRHAPSRINDQMSFSQKALAARAFAESQKEWRELEKDKSGKFEEQARLMMQHEKIAQLPDSERRDRNWRVNEWDRETFELTAAKWLGDKERQEYFKQLFPNEGSLLDEYLSGEWKEGEMRYLPDRNLSRHEVEFIIHTLDELLLINPEYGSLFDRFFEEAIKKETSSPDSSKGSREE